MKCQGIKDSARQSSAVSCSVHELKVQGSILYVLTPFRFLHLYPTTILVRSIPTLNRIPVNSVKTLQKLLGCTVSKSWDSLFLRSGIIRMQRRLLRSSNENRKRSEYQLLPNLAMIFRVSQSHVSSRTRRLPNQEPAANRIESRLLSEKHLVLNPDRIPETP